MPTTPRADYHAEQPSLALTIIEVAESSLPYDRGRKLRLYARCAVPECWVVNIPERCVEVYSRPLENLRGLRALRARSVDPTRLVQ